VYRVFRVPPTQAFKIDALLKDNVVSRQSIVVREARTLGIGGEGTIVLIEGSEQGLAQAETLLEGLTLGSAEAEIAYAKFKTQDEDAATGMGLLFGA
jgi:hypothetical protein